MHLYVLEPRDETYMGEIDVEENDSEHIMAALENADYIDKGGDYTLADFDLGMRTVIDEDECVAVIVSTFRPEEFDEPDDNDDGSEALELEDDE